MPVDKFVWQEGELNISQCVFCRHWQGQKKCTAFPDEIPMKIRTNEHDHRKPYPDDNGIRFEELK